MEETGATAVRAPRPAVGVYPEAPIMVSSGFRTPSDHQWQRVKSVFLAAIDIPESERRAFIAEACAGDEEALRQVESLLKSDESAGSFCETPAALGLQSKRDSISPLRRD